MATPGRDTLLNIEHPGGPTPLVFPDSGDIRAHLEAVLTGREYPLIPLPGYAPQVIVDVGANVGASAMFFHLSFPAARVLCYEPSPASAAYLRRNLGGANVEIHECGLSDRAERVRLFIGSSQSMQNSLARSVETSDAFEEVEVRRSSDEWRERGLGRVGILKIDTEGCEVPILRDLGPRLADVDFIYVEYHSEDDRRTIDAMLAEWFVLSSGSVFSPHRGTFVYLNKRMFERYPELDRIKIALG